MIYYHDQSGRVSRRLTGADDHPLANLQPSDAGYAISDEYFDDLAAVRVVAGVLHELPPQPSDLHAFDFAAGEWAISPARTAAYRANLALQINTRRDWLGAQPIDLDGMSLEADATALRNIANKIGELDECAALGVAVPADLLFWRDADNATHTWPDVAAYRAWLGRYAIAISQRGSRLYAASWALKSALQAIEAPADLLSFDVTAGWPA